MMLVPRVRKMERHPRPEDVFLLVEVSDSSIAYDRERKLTAYAKAGVREYWIVNLQQDILEVFRQPADGIQYRPVLRRRRYWIKPTVCQDPPQ